MSAQGSVRSNENDRTPDPLDERWFVVDSEKWAEVVRLLERAPEPKPRLADLLRERGMFASQQVIPPGGSDA